MNKQQYLDELREQLSYELPPRLIEPSIAYYSNYIDQEIAGGKTEKEVLEYLGDPRLIARTIADAHKSGADGTPGTDDDNNFAQEIYGGTGAQGTSGTGSGSGGYGTGNSGDSYGSGGYGSGGYGSGTRTVGGDGASEEKRGIGSHAFGCILFFIIALVIISVITLLLGLLSSPVVIIVLAVLLIGWVLRGSR